MNSAVRLRGLRRLAGGLLPVLLALAGFGSCWAGPLHAQDLALHVSGNMLVDAGGAQVILRGVNRSGSEYACIHSRAFTDGPTDRASLDAMRSWGLNAVRIPLNEDCWLGINGVALGGASYQRALAAYVQAIKAAGMYPVLDLHFSAPGAVQAIGQQPMPDADHAIAFWQGLAAAFGRDDAVIFDLFNEPHPQLDADEVRMWTCWRDGCPEVSTKGVVYRAVGMQALVHAVRAAGAGNVLMLGGIHDAASVDHWAAYLPADPLHNLAVSQHLYAHGVCSTSACWDATTALLARRFPVIAGEVGDTDCTITNTGRLLGYLEAHQISYLGWDWGVNFGCQSLISAYGGTPTRPYGQWFHDTVLRAEGRLPPLVGVAMLVDNVGLVSDDDPGGCSFDDLGYCYSSQALAQAGLPPGGTVGYGSAIFHWDVIPGRPDNLIAAGQTVPISPTMAGAPALALIGAASHGPFTGPLTLIYTDGTTATTTIAVSDWTLDGGASTVVAGDTVLVRAAYRDKSDGTRQLVPVSLFGVRVPLDRSKTLQAVTLPTSPPGPFPPRLHVFALSEEP